MNIKCLLYARYSTSMFIHCINKDTDNSSLTNDAEKMPSKIKALRLTVGQRQQIKTQYGVWSVTHDDNDLSYAVCTSKQYPQRHAYGLIRKLQEKLAEIKHCEYETEENIKNKSKKYAAELVVNYNDVSKIDKVGRASNEVKELEGEIGTGIKKLMDNQESLNSMSDKAQRMKSYAVQFQANSEKLQRMLYYRNCKIKVIVGLCILGLLGFIILIIVQRTKSS